jgi:hypothetical protein
LVEKAANGLAVLDVLKREIRIWHPRQIDVAGLDLGRDGVRSRELVALGIHRDHPVGPPRQP